MLLAVVASAAKVNKVTITTAEPVVGEKNSFKASVPSTASVEVYEVHWFGDFEKGRFVQGNDYTITVKVRIKEGSPNIVSTTSNVNATINGRKARVTHTTKKTITIKYTWKTLGGENPNNPKTKLRSELKELAAAYKATSADNDKVLLKYLRDKLPDAEIWLAGGSYSYTKKVPSETADGNISVTIGITHKGVTLDWHNFTVVLPALNKSPIDAQLKADMELMKTALRDFVVTAKTTGDEVLAAVNAAAIHGTKAVWGENFKYEAPTAKHQGSIDGSMLLTLGDKKDIIRAHKTLPIAGTTADAAIDADFSELSKALHKFTVNNKTPKHEVLSIANASIKNGSKLTVTNYAKTYSVYEKEGKIVVRFLLENDGKTREPRIALRIPKMRPELPAGISVSQDEWEVLRLTNKERFKEGRTVLAMVAELQDAGDIRAKEIVTDMRKDHLRPDGRPFHTAVDRNFTKNMGCGENAHQGSFDPSRAMYGWMNSKGHRDNILYKDYCYFGAGVYPRGTEKYWVQLFAVGDRIISAETSTGSNHFETVAHMEEAYLICRGGSGIVSYVPLEDDYMVKNGNQYTMHLLGLSITIIVDGE